MIQPKIKKYNDTKIIISNKRNAIVGREVSEDKKCIHTLLEMYSCVYYN